MEKNTIQLAQPYWQVIGYDKEEFELIQHYYRERPDPVKWALEYFNTDDMKMFGEPASPTGDYYNRAGDKLSDMIEDGEIALAEWALDVPYDGNCEGAYVRCSYIERICFQD